MDKFYEYIEEHTTAALSYPGHWMVWQMGGYPPHKKFATYEEAREEACRLAILNRNARPFCVLRVVTKIRFPKNVVVSESIVEDAQKCVPTSVRQMEEKNGI